MTDFNTELLPDEEEPVELLPQRHSDARATAGMAVRSAAVPRSELADAGNAALAGQLGRAGTRPLDVEEPAAVAQKEPAPPLPRHERAPGATKEAGPSRPTMDAKPVTQAEKAPDADPSIKQEAEQPRADPASARRRQLALLTQTLSRLPDNPERAPLDALFTAYRQASMDEQREAALVIANAILRIDTDSRRRARRVLAATVATYRSHPLAQLLALRLGAWVTAHPAPAPPTDPGGGP